jgi:putative oxidoreductase
MNTKTDLSSNAESTHFCLGCMAAGCVDSLFSLPGRLSAWFNRHAQDFAPIFLRVLLAYEFGEAGLEKLGGENWFADLSFPFPFNLLPADFSWTLSTGLEIIAPIALLLGLFTRFFSLALMVLTVVAIAAVHWPSEWHTLAELWQGYAITNKGYGNFKLPLMYMLMLSTLVFSGAGRLSIDQYRTSRETIARA